MMNPERPHDATTALTATRTLAFKAIDLLLAHEIEPTPPNFSVAYEYLAGTVEAMSRQIDDRLAAGKRLDAYFLRDLYDHYLAVDRFARIHGMRLDLQNLLAAILESVASAGNDTTAFLQTLEKGIQRLDAQPAEEALREIAGELLAATRLANNATQSLHASLASAHREAEQLRTELEQQRLESLIDPLTGLYNRRALEQLVMPLLAEGHEDKLTLLLIDIDYFKRINDTYGHAVGDIVIRQVADTLRRCIRGGDVAIRFGGEEFLIMLPDTPPSGAVIVAEAIRRRVEALRLVRRGDNLSITPFTVSVGVAGRGAGDTWETLFQRVDRALYQAKNTGRNRVSRLDR